MDFSPFIDTNVTLPSSDDADEELYAPLNVVQALSDTDGYLTRIEVSALTTPDNELAERAAKDPGSLSIADYELWYCTAYVSSICYQLQEVITDSVASPVWQVADSEGAILEKTELLMVLRRRHDRRGYPRNRRLGGGIPLHGACRPGRTRRRDGAAGRGGAERFRLRGRAEGWC